MKKTFLYFSLIIFIVSLAKASFSEPFVVLEYRGNKKHSMTNTDNLFLNNLNYNSQHVVSKNETLSDIMLNYYGLDSFNNNILSLAIVHFNKHAFVRNNPNFLFSGKKIYLPSVNEIKNLVVKKIKKPENDSGNNSSNSSQIYFFGG